MKLEYINSININNKYKYHFSNNNLNRNQYNTDISENLTSYNPIFYAPMFTGKMNAQKEKLQKDKLNKQLEEILKPAPHKTEDELTDEEFEIRAYQKYSKEIDRINQKAWSYVSSMYALKNNKSYTPEQKYNMAMELMGQFRKLKEPVLNLTRPKRKIDKKDEIDASLDLQLVNNFQKAALNDDYNFGKIYKDYYSKLENITSIDELKKTYPKIKIPKYTPEEVISKKIVNNLDKNFFDDFDDLCEDDNYEGAFEYSREKLREACKNLNKKYKNNTDKMYERLEDKFLDEVMNKYKKIKYNISPSNTTKTKTNNITQLDMDLLNCDYENFILYTIKEQYINSKGLKDIKYKNNGFNLPISSLFGTEYQFEKPSEKIKTIVKLGNSIEESIRDYKHSDSNQLKDRLNHYVNKTNAGDNSKIFNRIFEFYNCNYTEEDKLSLGKFLEGLDKIHDGEIKQEDFADILHNKEYKPIGTIKQKESERKAFERQMQEIQIQNNKLIRIQDKFDQAIDTLYNNDLQEIANLCFSYYPQTLDDTKNIYNSKQIIDIVDKYTTKGKENIPGLEATLTKWAIYNYYAENFPQNSTFTEAVEKSKDKYGNPDIIKAGQYIMINGIIHNYYIKILGQNHKLFGKMSNFKETTADYNNTKNYYSLKEFEEYKELSKSEKAEVDSAIEYFSKINTDKNNNDSTIYTLAIEDKYYEKGTLYKHPEVLKEIMEECKNNKEKAIEAIVKLDNFTALPNKERINMAKINSTFDDNNKLDSILKKDIILNDYINSDTVAMTKLNNGKSIQSAITSDAKKEILYQYNYPICNRYFKGFEEALSKFTTERNHSGIKKLGSERIELKITWDDDRLLSSKNDLVFDIYEKKGLHTKKS